MKTIWGAPVYRLENNSTKCVFSAWEKKRLATVFLQVKPEVYAAIMFSFTLYRLFFA